MSEMQGTLFEFDKNNELHRKAQHYIETMDREKFPSFGDLMVATIVDYFDRYYEQEAGAKATADVSPDPELDARIEAAVERALERKLPEILEPLLEDVSRGAEASEEEEADAEDGGSEHIDLEAVKNDINWGFLGG